MSNTLRNMKFKDVESNAGGIRSISFLAHKSSITNFPSFADAPADAAGEVTLDGDFTMASGANFVEIYTRKGTGKVDFETAGPKDGKYFKNTAEIDYPDVDDEAMALAKSIINSDMVLVIGTRVANSNKFKFTVLGGEMFPCEASVAGSTGTLDGDDKKCAFTFEAKDTVALKRYAGVIKTTDGSWDCSTGIYTADV